MHKDGRMLKGISTHLTCSSPRVVVLGDGQEAEVHVF